MIPGFGPISGGSGGGVSVAPDLSAGPSATGDQTRTGGNTWNFAPPQYQVAAQRQQTAGQQWQTVAIIGAALAAMWLFTRK